MKIEFEKTAKILSRCLTALVSIRSLIRSGIGIKKLVADPANEKKDQVKHAQLHGALIGMGYGKAETERTIKDLSGRMETESLQDLVRLAINILNSSK